MLRLTLLWCLVAFLCAYAFRSWFTSLCGLILLTALSQHPDMPHSVLGVPGLNPWNLVFFVVVAASLMDHKSKPPALPRGSSLLLKAYVALLIVGGLRALLDLDPVIQRGNIGGVLGGVFELLFNPVKYVVVGVLFFRGCRTRKNLWMGVHTLLLFGILHALLMYKSMKGMVFFGTYSDARRMTDKLIGLYANDLAGLLTFALWSLIVYAILMKGRARLCACLAAGVILPTIVGCQSRGAYVANVGVALLLGAVRWRKLLIVAPVVGAAVILVFPKIVTRIMTDVDVENVAGEYSTDWNDVTAGRTGNLWEPTIDQIAHNPVVGFGRYAIWRTPVYGAILDREGGVPGHPHNSYLEVLLDSGVVGLTIVLGLLVSVGLMAIQMVRSGENSMVVLLGGIGLIAVGCAALLGLSQSVFYPRESLLWLICSIALTLRGWVTWQTILLRQPSLVHAGVAVQGR